MYFYYFLEKYKVKAYVRRITLEISNIMNGFREVKMERFCITSQ